MPLVNWETSLDLTWSKKCLISSVIGITEFKITEAKFYAHTVALSAKDNVKLLKQLESGFQRTINQSKYHPRSKTFPQNRYLNYLIDPTFQGLNRLFLLPFANETDREANTKYYLPTEKTKYYDVIGGISFFDQPIKNDFKTIDNIRQIATGQRDDYATGCLLDYYYFKEHSRLITLDLCKQKKLGADPKSIQQINFTGSIEKGTSIFFIIEIICLR